MTLPILIPVSGIEHQVKREMRIPTIHQCCDPRRVVPLNRDAHAKIMSIVFSPIPILLWLSICRSRLVPTKLWIFVLMYGVVMVIFIGPIVILQPRWFPPS